MLCRPYRKGSATPMGWLTRLATYRPGHRCPVMLAGRLPPPPGGVETITKLIWESSLRSNYRMELFEIHRTRGKEFQGRFDARNLRDAALQVMSCLLAVARRRPRVFHAPLSATGTGFLRDMALIWTAKALGSYTVAHSHGSNADTLYLQGGPWRRRLIRCLLHGVDHLVVLSPYWERHFSRLMPRTRITVMPIGVSPAFVVPLARLNSDRPDPFVVLFVGEIGARKGVHDLIEAVALISDDIPTLAVRIVGTEGSPGIAKSYEERVKELGLQDTVTLLGPRMGADLIAEYRAAEVLALPSYAENQPSVLIEAMATGACVISSTLTPIMAVVSHRVNGLLVHPGDTAALADALKCLYSDPDLRVHLREGGYETVRSSFMPDRFIDDVGAVYREALRGRSV